MDCTDEESKAPFVRSDYPTVDVWLGVPRAVLVDVVVGMTAMLSLLVYGGLATSLRDIVLQPE